MKQTTDMFLKLLWISIFLLFCSSQRKAHLNFQPAIVENWKSKKPFPESKFYIFGNQEYLHFTEFKPKQKAIGKILLIHGFSGSTYSFRNNISPLLELNYLVIAVDLPNFGYSARISGFDHSNEFRAKLLLDFLSFYEGYNPISRDKWIVLGHSMGATVVSYMAQMKQERMEKLILVAPALGEEAGYFLKLVTYLPFVEKITKSWIQNTLSDKERFGKILQSAYGISPFYPLEEEIEGYRKPLLLENTIEYSFDLVRNSQSKSPLILENILIPVYVVHGLNDNWVSFKNVIQQIKKFPNAKLIVYSKVGHCPMETNAEEFNRDLKLILKN